MFHLPISITSSLIYSCFPSLRKPKLTTKGELYTKLGSLHQYWSLCCTLLIQLDVIFLQTKRRSADGYAYPYRGMRIHPCAASFGGHTTSLLGFLPPLEVAPLFAPVSGYSRPYYRYTQVIIGSRHFLVAGYHDYKWPINQSIQAIHQDLIWRGELAVFGLGNTVPYLGCPGEKVILDDVATL